MKKSARAPSDNPYAQADVQYSNSSRPRQSEPGRGAPPPYARSGYSGGGYGGDDDDLDAQDAGREKLFAGAKVRATRRQAETTASSQNESAGSNSRYGNRYGGHGVDPNREGLFSGARERAQPRNDGGDGGFDGYGEQRQLTEEEQEEKDLADTKSRISEVKDQSVNSTRRALQAGEAALESSRAIMSRINSQGDRLFNTKQNLQLASSHNKVAHDRTRELKTLNRSMFAVSVSNPFGARARREQEEADLLERHRQEREDREGTKRDAQASNQRLEQAVSNLAIGERTGPAQKAGQRNLAGRSKYQFEADVDDDAKEDEIDDNIDRLAHVTQSLHRAGLAIGREIDEQNKFIGELHKTSDHVDDGVRVNRANLSKIK